MGARGIDTQGLLLRLEVARRRLGPNAIIASDGDGTIWQGDIGDDLFEALVAEQGVRAEAMSMLRYEAERFGVALDSAMTPTDVAVALFESYRAGVYAEDRTFAMMAWVFAGWRRTEVQAFCRRVLEGRDFANRLREELGEVLKWAAKHDVPFWIVSASPQCGVHAAAEALGIPLEHTLSMEPNCADGVIDVGLAELATYGPGKMMRLSAATNDQPLLAAFGDSSWDGEMLRASEVPVAVYPAPSLKEQLDSIDGVCVLGADDEPATG